MCGREWKRESQDKNFCLAMISEAVNTFKVHLHAFEKQVTAKQGNGKKNLGSLICGKYRTNHPLGRSCSLYILYRQRTY